MAYDLPPGPIDRSIDQDSNVSLTDTTLTAVTGLAFDMDPGVKYVIEGTLFGTADAASRDIKAGVSGVTDLTGTWVWETQDATNVRVPAAQILAAGAVTGSAVTDIADANDIGVIWFHAVVSSADGGTFQVTAAQGTDAGTTVARDGRMTVRRAGV